MPVFCALQTAAMPCTANARAATSARSSAPKRTFPIRARADAAPGTHSRDAPAGTRAPAPRSRPAPIARRTFAAAPVRHPTGVEPVERRATLPGRAPEGGLATPWCTWRHRPGSAHYSGGGASTGRGGVMRTRRLDGGPCELPARLLAQRLRERQVSALEAL